MAQKLLHYDVTHKKSATPNQKIFFECRQEDVPNFEGLNSSLTQSGRSYGVGKATENYWF